jgi:hypothetical protein
MEDYNLPYQEGRDERRKKLVKPTKKTGEACFFVWLRKSKTHLTGYQVALWFKLTQHSRDSILMGNLQEYLGCGYYCSYPARNYGDFRVTNLGDMTDKIIPFFDNYPLHGSKLKDFNDIKRVAELMKEKSHLTPEGLEQILVIKSGMNKGRD